MKRAICALLSGIVLLTFMGCQKTVIDESSTHDKDTSISIEQSQVTHSIADEEEPISWAELEAAAVIAPSAEEVTSSIDEPLNTSKDEIIEYTGETAIAPFDYQKMLGKGMDVDWAKTSKGRESYTEQAVIDFKASGISHVRIRVKDKANDALFKYLDKQIEDCLNHGLIPVIAYQADEFKNEPTQKNIDQVVSWWGKVAQRYQDKSHLLSFDLLIEATDALNKQPQKLNEIYEQLVTEIRKTNPTRIIIMSPRLRSDAAYLSELEVPTDHNNYMMAEWHFYASGPSKTNDRKLWTTGTKEEQDKITEKIDLALQWQKDTGIPTWVGAWMAGNYNDGDDYTIEEQVTFASFMVQSLSNAGIPFAVNSDTKFYDRETNQWVQEMQPVFNAVYK